MKQPVKSKNGANFNRNYLTVIPAYNEAETIREVVEGALQHTPVCVVDDASKDDTPNILADLKKKHKTKLHIITHEKNTHIPGGIQDGMRYATDNNFDWVITMDAGLSHDPENLRGFIEHPDCDLVIGARRTTTNVPLYRKAISRMAALVMNYSMSRSIFDLRGPGISDCTSGFRRYSRPAFAAIAASHLKSVSFDFHLEALYLVNKMGGSINETAISYIFSNSSFNRRVLKQAIKFASGLLAKKFF